MHTSPSGKVYIGITCKPLNERFGFEGNGYKLQPYFWRAIQKYGWNNIKHEVLLSGLSRSEACEKEREYIAKYRSNESAFGYNQTNGGDTGYNLSSESVAVLSEKSKRHWEEMSPEEREGIIQRKKEFAAGLTEEEKKAIYTKVERRKWSDTLQKSGLSSTGVPPKLVRQPERQRVGRHVKSARRLARG